MSEMMQLFCSAIKNKLVENLAGYVLVDYYSTTDVIKIKCMLSDVRFTRTYESGTYFAHNGKSDYIIEDFLKAYKRFIINKYFR